MQIDKKSGLRKVKKGVWILEEMGLWDSQGGEKSKDVCLLLCLFFSVFLRLSHRKCFVFVFVCLFVLFCFVFPLNL